MEDNELLGMLTCKKLSAVLAVVLKMLPWARATWGSAGSIDSVLETRPCGKSSIGTCQDILAVELEMLPCCGSNMETCKQYWQW